MKKFFSWFIAFALLLTCAFVVGCDKKGGDTSGEFTKSELSELYIEIAKNSWQKLGAGDPTINKTAKTTGITFDSEAEETKGDDGLHIKANGASTFALINMIGEFYARDEFIVSDNFVSVSVTHDSVTAIFSVKANIDKENDYVFIELALDVSNVEVMYLFEINYDFDLNSLKSYRLIYYDTDTLNDQEIKEDGKTYLATKSDVSENYIVSLDAVYSNFQERKSSSQMCQGDFSQEYARYAEYSQKAFQNVVQNNA